MGLFLPAGHCFGMYNQQLHMDKGNGVSVYTPQVLTTSCVCLSLPMANYGSRNSSRARASTLAGCCYLVCTLALHKDSGGGMYTGTQWGVAYP
jgi:hypothetical protein